MEPEQQNQDVKSEVSRMSVHPIFAEVSHKHVSIARMLGVGTMIVATFVVGLLFIYRNNEVAQEPTSVLQPPVSGEPRIYTQEEIDAVMAEKLSPEDVNVYTQEEIDAVMANNLPLEEVHVYTDEELRAAMR